MTNETKTQIDALIAEMITMSHELEGCDWCCGGGDERMEQIVKDLGDLGATRNRSIWFYPNGAKADGQYKYLEP